MKEPQTDQYGIEYPSEWYGEVPSNKEMGSIDFYLNEGQTFSVKGIVYGLSNEVQAGRFKASLYLDHYNRRLLVHGFQAEDTAELVKFILTVASANGYEKTSVRCHKDQYEELLKFGFEIEGSIPGYFKGKDAYVISHFTPGWRKRSPRLNDANKIIADLKTESGSVEIKPLNAKANIYRATQQNISQMVSIFRQVFKTYPSPVKHPDYLKAAMATDAVYMMSSWNGDMLAVAGAEIDRNNLNAEMTDCATLPQARGRGLMKHILSSLEENLKKKGIITAYALCRSTNIAMNKVFHQLGYQYSGRMINNCDIAGQFEDMNIWAKPL